MRSNEGNQIRGSLLVINLVRSLGGFNLKYQAGATRNHRTMTTFCGADWAGHGWVTATSTGDGPPDIGYQPTVYDVWKSLAGDRRLAIDIPIGLTTDGRRHCDLEARRVLQTRGNSLFYTPTREAVYETNLELAKDAQEHLDFSVQNQVWSLVPRIREVDRFIQATAETLDQHQVIETHPEVAFAALNGGLPMERSKKEELGGGERLAALEETSLTGVGEAYRKAREEFGGPDYATKLAKPDDILDALVALVVAMEGGHEPPALPQRTEADVDTVLDRRCRIAYSVAVDWPALDL
jgi:predicted RNase H-like nuclease